MGIPRSRPKSCFGFDSSQRLSMDSVLRMTVATSGHDLSVIRLHQDGHFSLRVAAPTAKIMRRRPPGASVPTSTSDPKAVFPTAPRRSPVVPAPKSAARLATVDAKRPSASKLDVTRQYVGEECS